MDLEFSDDGIDAIATIASEVNTTVENIGARRLHTIIEKNIRWNKLYSNWSSWWKKL